MSVYELSVHHTVLSCSNHKPFYTVLCRNCMVSQITQCAHPSTHEDSLMSREIVNSGLFFNEYAVSVDQVDHRPQGHHAATTEYVHVYS